jgi:hypothetical protein
MKQLVVFSAVIFLIQGCAIYSIEKINAPEYLEKPDGRISKVVFESGSYIQFNEDGGNYYDLKNCIAGITDYNKYVVIPIDKIRDIVTNSGVMSPGQFLEADTTGIQQIILTNGVLHLFKYLPAGGRYYKDGLKIVAGIDTSSKFYQFGTDSISYLDIYKFNKTKSYLVDFGLASLFVGAVICYISTIKLGPFLWSN